MSEQPKSIDNVTSKLENQRVRIDQQTKSKRITPLIMQPNLNSNQHSSAHRKNQPENRTPMKENNALESMASEFIHAFASPASGQEMGAGEPVEKSGNLLAKSGQSYPFDVIMNNGSDDIHSTPTHLDLSLNAKGCTSITTQSVLDMSHPTLDDSVDLESLLLPVTSAKKMSQNSTLQNAFQAPKGIIQTDNVSPNPEGMIQPQISSQTLEDIIQTHVEAIQPIENVEDSQQKLKVTSKKKKNVRKKEKKQKQIEELEINQVENSNDKQQVSNDLPQDPIVDTANVEDLILRSVPQGVTMKCRITRDKSGMDRNIYPTYFLHLEHDSGRKIFLLGSRKRKKTATSNYVISNDPSDLSRSGKSYCGKLRSNLLGTQFILFGCGENLKSGPDRQELAAITYESNILGLKGPRKMTVITPQIENEHQFVNSKPQGTHNGLIEKWKRRDTKDLLEFHNKTPVWNEDTQTHTLNFNGRATQASVKNFQIVNNNDVDYIVMQLGKVSENVFTMDYNYPLCALQAFGIALSSFDGKLVCE